MRNWFVLVLVVLLLVAYFACGEVGVTPQNADIFSIDTRPPAGGTRIQSALSSGGWTYTVQAGDTLMGISRKLFNGDSQYWDEIAAINSIKSPYTIYPGQVLSIPAQ